MDQKSFNEVFKQLIKKCESTLVNRAQSYSTSNDRMRNFKHTGWELDIPSHRMPWVLSSKQREALNEALKSPLDSSKWPLYQEWIIDQINYLILTYAMIKEAVEDGSHSDLS